MDWGLVAFLLLITMWLELGAFVVLYLTRSDWQVSPTGRAIAAFFGVVLLSFAGFIALAMAPIPGWIFVVVFLAGNVVMAKLLRLLIRAQRRERTSPERTSRTDGE